MGSLLDKNKGPRRAPAERDPADDFNALKPPQDSRPAGRDGASRDDVDLDDVAPNPRNERDMASASTVEHVAELAESMRDVGQLQACAVVTREAYLAIFPEDAHEVGHRVRWVQVNGACRRAAVEKLGRDKLRIDVQDHLAESRIRFMDATTAENLERANLNPIEEARQIAALVAEHEAAGTSAPKAAVAAAYGKSGGWVSQVLNRLTLATEVQAALASGELPVRAVLNWHSKLTKDQQVEKLHAWQRRMRAADSFNALNPDDHTPITAAPKRTATERAVRRLGDTTEARATSLFAVLDEDAIRDLAEDLLRRLDGGADE